MKSRFLVLAMFLGLVAHAQTIYVEGKQTGVWDADTIRVVGDVMVVDTLKIVRPGSVVLFDQFYGISVPPDASLFVLGADTAKIVFTVSDTTGFHVYDQGKGGWNGLQFRKASRVVLDHCLLQYGKASDEQDPFGGALFIVDCDDVTVSNSTLRCNFARESGGAVYALRSKVRFKDCAINENKVYTGDDTYAMYGGGACFKQCDVEMDWVEFFHNYGPTCIGGGMSLDSCSLVLDHANFGHNIGLNGGGLYLLRSNDWDCRISNSLFADNFSGHFGGGLAIAAASPEICNITVTRNSSEGVTCNGIFFYQESSPKLTNCIVYGNYPLQPMSSHGDTIQMWVWTYDDYSPEFRNCLIEKGLNSMTVSDSLLVFEDIIDADPLFLDPEGYDFRLQEGSPCIDAGNLLVPDFMVGGWSLDGMSRVCNARIDVGAYEYSAYQVPESPSSQKEAFLLGNPLNGQSRVEFELAQAGSVTVRVCSLTGCELVSQSLGWLQAGRQAFSLSALAERLKPGLYLIEISTPERNYVLKAVR